MLYIPLTPLVPLVFTKRGGSRVVLPTLYERLHPCPVSVGLTKSRGSGVNVLGEPPTGLLSSSLNEL